MAKHAIILAAGMGKRMKSDLQKVMHPILGKPIVQYVAEAAKVAGCEKITVVTGKGGEEVQAALSKAMPALNFAVQEEQLGTGHAVQSAVEAIAPTDEVLVLCGDMPLVTAELIEEFYAFAIKHPCDAMVAAVYLPQIMDFGRVYDEDGIFKEIVEARDITPKHAKTQWANTGIYYFKAAPLIAALDSLGNNNSQNEYYLTDAPKIISDTGAVVRVYHSYEDLSVFTGINTQIQLAQAAMFMRERINAFHMLNGVRMLDPVSVFIDSSVKIAANTVIYPNVILEGNCEIAEGAVIGANCHLTNVTVGAKAHLRQTVATDAKIGEMTETGPFAYLRPGTVIGKKCRVGNFVEVKNATLGDGVKMAHLAYIGDAEVGDNVNYSCGAITANYDGKNKHKTVIHENAFIGSNANLIAPVTVEKDGFVAAGSTITDNVPPCALAIARARQTNKANYRNGNGD